MKNYQQPTKAIWTGRHSTNQLYMHEKVELLNLTNHKPLTTYHSQLALLGYACDEGVRRNKGRIGAVEGPDAIRYWLGKKANHLDDEIRIYDGGNVVCLDHKIEETQKSASDIIRELLSKNMFPIVLGGGHDLASAHYNGIKSHLNSINNQGKVGIINLDAHFDLRSDENGPNSGTPFYQIAYECKQEDVDFNYLCLGIQSDSNDPSLFNVAQSLGAEYITMENFKLSQLDIILSTIESFITRVDHVYLTIDLDGFSLAYAPGVSAPSPFGFSPELALECINIICQSNKLISMDIVELNPKYDIDGHTARLAAGLIHRVLTSLPL